jgi:peptidoglycan hydrolase-like protein with peptidoglycan-binding domain
MSRVVIGVLVVAALAGAGLAGYAVLHRDRPAAAAPKPLPTVPVTRGDLVSSAQQPGQLGFLGTYQLVGHRAGTITALPGVGQVIDRGQPVYSVDQRPVPLLFGTVPLYRALGVDATGEDVRELEQNLAALGFGGFTVDDRFTSATQTAVKRWQHALGVPETGAVEAGDAMVAPGAVRITAVRAVLGGLGAPGQEVASGTGTGHGVHVDLDRKYRPLVATGQQVRVQLFGGHTVTGVVDTIGEAATPVPDPGAGNQNANQQTVPVDLTVTSPEAELGGVVEGPVTVTFPGASRRGVLTVPVEALTAQPTGDGYAVVVVDGTGRHTVPVTVGLITASRVEISGVPEGARVEVPGL